MYSFPNLEPVRCSMSSSICCFLTCIQISQEAGKVVWYSYLLKNFPQFVVIHTVKGFGIVSEAEVDVFLEFSCFFFDSTDVGNLISGISKYCQFQNFSEKIWGNWLNLVVGFFFFMPGCVGGHRLVWGLAALGTGAYPWATHLGRENMKEKNIKVQTALSSETISEMISHS